MSFRALIPTVFLSSAAVIAWQIALMRLLVISGYYHFSFLVISCALLGFGVGGVVLTAFGRRIRRRAPDALRVLLVSFAVSIPMSLSVGGMLPVQVYFPPMTAVSALALWGVFWLVHLVPFLLAGTLIGLALTVERQRAARVYASSLAGSAVGALGIMLLLSFVIPSRLPVIVAVLPLLGGVFLCRDERGTSSWFVGILVSLGAVLGGLLLLPPEKVFPPDVDQYKGLAYARQLEREHKAREVRTVTGVRSTVSLFDSDLFHTLLAFRAATAPPRMQMLFQNGFQSGALPLISSTEQAAFLGSTLSAMPYRLTRPERVLILGESGTLYAWTALTFGAEQVVLVQPDAAVVEIVSEHPTGIAEHDGVTIIRAEPRAFLDTTNAKFDVIHLASLEGFSPGSGGIGSLKESYLATTEGFQRCFEALTPNGIACVTRGIQEPLRDNLKIAATWTHALEHHGIESPSRHIIAARDELSLCTLVRKTHWDPDSVHRFRDICSEQSLDPERHPAINPEDTNTTHILPGPENSPVSWYHYGLRKIFSEDREQFYRDWICYIRPARDDSPFFHDFFKWSSVEPLREAFGPLWPARSEMGYLLLLAACVWTSILGIVCLAVPTAIHAVRRSGPNARTSLIVILYFGCLGIAFMFVEMGLIQLFTRFLGDPVQSAALVLGGLLLFAGLGSMLQPRLSRSLPQRNAVICGAISTLIIVFALIAPSLFRLAGMLPVSLKLIASLMLIFPPALLMGCPFPWGLSALGRETADVTVPVGWAANGFASVVSASLAVLLAMEIGFTALLAVAGGLYIAAGAVSYVLARES